MKFKKSKYIKIDSKSITCENYLFKERIFRNEVFAKSFGCDFH